MLKRTATLGLGVVAAMFMLSSLALSAESLVYVCIEEKSVGWESKSLRGDGKDVYGRFALDDKPFFLKYRSGRDVGDNYILPEIVVTEDGKDFQYYMDAVCNRQQTILKSETLWRLDTPGRCKREVEERKRDSISFGQNRWTFDKSFEEKPNSVRYAHVSIAPWFHDAIYASSGSCTLAN